LTNAPFGSLATINTNSPLGANVPVYKMADRLTLQVAGRAVLVPDVVGQYTVIATINTSGSGSTNVTQTITVATYVGADICKICHSGGLVASNTYVPWSGTRHAVAFTEKIDGIGAPTFSSRCVSCHVTGYDANTNANNGGFDDVAAAAGWSFPTNIAPGNWAAMPASVKALANIQCESCHGPGSQHASQYGNTNFISTTFAVGDCAQCHDSLSHHSKVGEWKNSRHAVATRSPSGPNRAACARCHTAGGFAQYANTLAAGTTYTTNNANTAYEAIGCQTCHDPHDASNPFQLRTSETSLMADGVTRVNAGSGALCMECHRSRNGSVTNSIERYPALLQTWAGGSSFGVHDNNAADMLEGVNGWTYGKVIPSSAHATSVTNTCVGCHMQTVASTDPAFLKAGGHTFSMAYNVVTNGVTNVVDKVAVCVQCHGNITSFDMVKVDYNGDGVIEGVQTEVTKLYDKLSTLLPPRGYVASGNYIADGLVKSPQQQTNWPAKFLKAFYNYGFVKNDLSKGVHNTAYAVGLLKASIADLTGDANTDGLPDSWQVTYFGSATSTNAGPNACPAGDGIPNWLKYSLGLNPNVAGVVLPDGVVWMNGSNMVSPDNAGDTSIKIFTAAEIVFDTQVGTSYQIQGVSSLSGGWTNIGSAIAGTGGSVSYVTPTRSNAQMFFRVVHTP
ncbi:MAG TPA: multiheme c-type cytochrome, partial [Candidatus Paceibacterota bacterium]|nr:multiheme c-type cytochrome [Candidatus Paceibacterota bacterium]